MRDSKLTVGNMETCMAENSPQLRLCSEIVVVLDTAVSHDATLVKQRKQYSRKH